MRRWLKEFTIIIFLFFFHLVSGFAHAELSPEPRSDRFWQMVQAYCLYPENNIIKTLYYSVPDRLEIPPHEKMRIGGYLLYSRFGEDIEAGNYYAIKAALKILNANRFEEDYWVRQQLDGVIKFHLGNLFRLKLQTYLAVLQDIWPEIDKNILKEISSSLPQDFWLEQSVFPGLCSIKPLDIICDYELIMRKKALALVPGYAEIKQEILKGIEDRLMKLGYFENNEDIFKLLEDENSSDKIIDMVARLSRFISYYKKVDDIRPELLPENYDQIKKKELHFRFQDSLTRFIFREAASGNRQAAKVIIRGEVGYHLEDWLDILGFLSKKEPEYFLDLLNMYRGTEENYKPYVIEILSRSPIRDILRQQSVPLEALTDLSIKVEQLPLLVEMDKRASSLKNLKATKHQELREICLRELEVTTKEIKKKLFFRKPLSTTQEIDIKILDEGYLYNPPEKLKIVLEKFANKPDNKNISDLFKCMVDISKRYEDEDLGLWLIVPAAKNFARGLPAERYLLLERAAMTGNKQAVGVLLAAYDNSSSLMKEIISSSLSYIIDRKPTLFLEALSEYKLSLEDIREIVRTVDEIRIDVNDIDKFKVLNQRKEAFKKFRKGKHSKLSRIILDALDQ